MQTDQASLFAVINTISISLTARIPPHPLSPHACHLKLQSSFSWRMMSVVRYATNCLHFVVLSHHYHVCFAGLRAPLR
jgi:hypothetical protein